MKYSSRPLSAAKANVRLGCESFAFNISRLWRRCLCGTSCAYVNTNHTHTHTGAGKRQRADTEAGGEIGEQLTRNRCLSVRMLFKIEPSVFTVSLLFSVFLFSFFKLILVQT